MTTLLLRTRQDVQSGGTSRPARLGVRPTPPTVPTTVGHLLSVYQREYLPTKSPGTQKQQGYVFRILRETLGDVPLADLTPVVLHQWRDQLAQQWKPGTVRQYMDSLSAALRIAVEDYDWLPANPLQKVHKPSEDPGRVRFLSDAELRRLLAACQASGQRALYPLVLLALSTRGRRREVGQLRWSEVDLERGSCGSSGRKTANDGRSR